MAGEPQPGAHPDVSQVNKNKATGFEIKSPREIIAPLHTGHALDLALKDLNNKFIAPEGSGFVRGGLLPLTSAIGAEASLRLAEGAILDTLGRAAGASAITTLVFSPIVSLVRRTAMGESAMRQAARYMLKNGGGNGLRGAITTLLTGAENKALRGVYFKENDTRKRLLQIAEDLDRNKETTVESFNLGSEEYIRDMMAEGMLAGSQAQALVDLGIPLSKVETMKLKNMVRMHETARKIFDAKAKTPGRQEELRYDILPKLVEGKERAMWVKNSAWLAAIGAGKSVAFAGALHVISLENIEKLAGGLAHAFRGVGEAIKQVAEPLIKVLRDVLSSLGADVPTLSGIKHLKEFYKIPSYMRNPSIPLPPSGGETDLLGLLLKAPEKLYNLVRDRTNNFTDFSVPTIPKVPLSPSNFPTPLIPNPHSLADVMKFVQKNFGRLHP